MHSKKAEYPRKIDETYFTGTEDLRDEITSSPEDVISSPDIKVAFFYSAKNEPDTDAIFSNYVNKKLEQQRFVINA